MQGIRTIIAGLLFAGAFVSLAGAGPDAEAEPGRPAARNKLLRAHHDKCAELFVKTSGFGRGRMVVLSHSSPSYPKSIELPGASGKSTSKWEMKSVELVSLLKGDKPGVYPADGMRLGGDVKAVKTRDLDTFEGRALARLRAGEQMQIDASATRARVLGAIRMQTSCKGCHAGKKEGDLLGAFTYDFKPAS